MGFPCGSDGKESACNAGELCSIPWLGRSPGEGAAHSRILAWRIPWTAEFMGLQSLTQLRDFHFHITSGPTNLWQMEEERVEAVTFHFLGLQNHCGQ